MDTKKKILSEAGKLFSKKGFDGTSIDEIAYKVGIKKASLYYHFKNKEEVFLEFLDDLTQSAKIKIDEVFNKSISDREKLRRLLINFGIFIKNKSKFNMMHGRYSNRMISKFMDKKRMFIANFVSKRLKKLEDFRDLSDDRIHFFMMMCLGTISTSAILGCCDIEEVVDELLNLWFAQNKKV